MERFLQVNGPIRRTLLTGLIFVFVFCIHYFWLVAPQDLIRVNQPDSGAVSLKDIIKSSQVLIVAAGFVFAVGGIIDAMTEGFIVRGVSTTRWIHWWLSEHLIPRPAPDQQGEIRVTSGSVKSLAPVESASGNDTIPQPATPGSAKSVAVEIARIVFNLLTFPIWPPIVMICTVLSSSDHYWLLTVGLLGNAAKRVKISKQAADFFKDVLSPNMQQGLNEPFCNQFDAAWQGLIAMIPEAHRQWANRLSLRNRDLASFLSSAFFALFISSACLLGAGRWHSWATVISYVLICLITWLLFGYVSLVARSVLSALELAAITSTSSIVR